MAVVREHGPGPVPDVVQIIRQDVRGDYPEAARIVASRGTDVVLLEHEYGIFGGEAGVFVLSLVRELRQPLVVTLHTVLSAPSVAQAETVRAVCERASLVMVFTETARRMVVEARLVSPERVRVVPHGAPTVLARQTSAAATTAASPSAADAGAPSAPDAGAPSAPDAGAPSAPDAVSPVPSVALERLAGRTVLSTFGPDLVREGHRGGDPVAPGRRRAVPRPPVPDKNGALLPRRVGGHFVPFHRPVTVIGAHADIWLSRSADLRTWSSPEPVLDARPGWWWDSARIGMGPPPLETAEGWLVVYHGVRQTVAGALYRAGLALLDLDDPSRVLRRGAEWVLGPRKTYELTGDVPGVVFPCGLVHDPGTDEIRLYYGAADTCIDLATSTLTDLLDYLRPCPHPESPA